MLQRSIRALSEEIGKAPDSALLKSLRGELAQAAQRVYDAWDQTDEGEDEELGCGGICQDIADAMVEVLIDAGIEAAAVSQQVGEQHVFVIAKLADGVFEVDISPYLYESGSRYHWTKREDVVFEAADIVLGRIDDDPSRFEEYVGDM